MNGRKILSLAGFGAPALMPPIREADLGRSSLSLRTAGSFAKRMLEGLPSRREHRSTDIRRRAGQPSIVLTYGTFDLFHYGHMRLLQRARALGTHLVVGLSTDEFNAMKGKRALMSYEERAQLLMACRFVDDVFPENCWEQKASDIVTQRASIFVMGDDWRGKFDHLSDLCAVSYLERTPLISSTMMREGLMNCGATMRPEAALAHQV